MFDASFYVQDSPFKDAKFHSTAASGEAGIQSLFSSHVILPSSLLQSSVLLSHTFTDLKSGKGFCVTNMW